MIVAIAPDWRARMLLIPVGLAVLGLAVALFRIGDQSIWYDEAVSIRYATRDLESTVSEVLGRDTNGVLYYALLRVWVFVFGSGEAAVRSLSAVSAAATLSVVFWLGNRVGGWATGLLSGLLLATSSMFVAYAQEARMYAPAMLAATAYTAILVLAAERRDRRLLAVYGVVGGLSIYVHLFAGATLIGQAVWLAWAVRRGALGRGDAAVALGVTGLVAAPLVPLIGRGSMVAWVPRATADVAVATFYQLAGSSAAILVLATSLLVVGGALAWLRRRDADGSVPVLVVLVALAPVVLGIAASPLTSLLVPRFYLVALPPICIVLAWVVLRLPRPAAALAALALVALNVVAVTSWYASPQKYDWPRLVAALAPQTRPFDGLVAAPDGALMLEYYGRREGFALPPITAAPDVPRVLRERPRRVWVVFYRWAEPAGAEALAAAGYRPSGRDQLFDPVRIRAYVDGGHIGDPAAPGN